MSHPPDPALSAGYAAALAAGAVATARAVEGVHLAVSRTAFGAVQLVPGLGPLTRAIAHVHDGIAGVAYASVRAGMSAGLALAARRAPALPATRLHGRLRSALNGTHGDSLAGSANPLAHTTAFYAGGGPLPLQPEALAAALPEATGRVCVFVHGLCCDESAWQGSPGTAARPYGDRLRQEAGVTPLYLRYNTGLPLAENGRALAEGLHALVGAYPVPAREVVLVGHSMGGLVALRACAEAEALGLPWLSRVRTVVGLGVPLRGAPLAKLGHAATAALRAVPYTSPLGALAEGRSAGLRDLRRGLGRGGPPARGPIAYRFVGASVRADAEGPLGRLVGDGLVTPGSAIPEGWSGDVEGVRIGGLGHLGLLNDPRVYGHLARWIRGLEAP